jgi:hypothetical protein
MRDLLGQYFLSSLKKISINSPDTAALKRVQTATGFDG